MRRSRPSYKPPWRGAHFGKARAARAFGLLILAIIAVTAVYRSTRSDGLRQGGGPAAGEGPAGDRPASMTGPARALPSLPAPTAEATAETGAGGAGYSALPAGNAPDYLAMYQGLSTRLPPTLVPHDSFPTVTQKGTEHDPQLTIWTVGNRAVVGGRARIQALLQDERGARVWPETAVVHVFPSGSPQEGYSTPMKATPADHDAMFTWDFVADPAKLLAFGKGKETHSPLLYSYFVHMAGTQHGEPFLRQAEGSFFVESPGADLDQKRLVAAREGQDLVVSLRIRVERPGRYWAGAQLWGGSDGSIPIALAQHPYGELAAGQHTVKLTFGGEILRDVGVDGPYVVRNINLNQTDTVPPHQSAPIDAFTTPPFKASDFGSVRGRGEFRKKS